MADESERRFVEARSSIGIQGRTLVGRAAVWNSPSLDLGGFREIVRPGAFTESLQRGGEVFALIDHDLTRLLGRRSAGTLRLAEDDAGLRYEVDLPDTSYARDLRELIARGDIAGSSFRFKVAKGGQVWRGTPQARVRELRSLHLEDVSVVTVPAYPSSTVSLRHYIAQ